MKSIIVTILVLTFLVACGKKEEAPAPIVAPTAPTAPAASEPTKTEEVKK